MKLKFKGKYTSEDELSKGNLPADAVVFKEPKTPLALNLVASIFVIPVIVLVIVAGMCKYVIEPDYVMGEMLNVSSFLLALLTILPHEALHAIAFPRNAEVEIWYSIKNMMAFTFSTAPTSKRRFIFLSLLPNTVFGFVPLVLWVILRLPQPLSQTLFSFSFVCLLLGIGDYLNVFNALIQMPKGATTQLSGFHSYWYMETRDASIKK